MQMSDKLDQYIQVNYRLSLIHQYMHRAIKHMNALTDEQIAQMPPYVKNVLPNIKRDTERDADWFSDLKAYLKQQMLEPPTKE